MSAQAAARLRSEQDRARQVGAQPNRDLKNLPKDDSERLSTQAILAKTNPDAGNAEPPAASAAPPAPRLPTPPKIRALHNEHDASILEELRFLTDEYNWFLEQPAEERQPGSLLADMLDTGRRMCLIRLMNSIHTRHDKYAELKQLSDNHDAEAGVLRSNLLHHFPSAKEVKKFYKKIAKQDRFKNAAAFALCDQSPPSPVKLGKYAQTFFTKAADFTVTDVIAKYMALLQRFFVKYQSIQQEINLRNQPDCPAMEGLSLSELYDFQKYLLRSMEFCLVMTGEMNRYLGSNRLYTQAQKDFIYKCCLFRNDATHDSEDTPESGFDPFKREDIVSMTESGLKIWAEAAPPKVVKQSFNK